MGGTFNHDSLKETNTLKRIKVFFAILVENTFKYCVKI